MPIPMFGINPTTLGRVVRIGMDIGGPSMNLPTDDNTNKTNGKKTAKPNDGKAESKTQTQTDSGKKEAENLRNDTQNKDGSTFSILV